MWTEQAQRQFNQAIMRGTIVITEAAAQALCGDTAAVRVGDVLHCAGRFKAGDSIYMALRGRHGGHYVIGAGVACCDEGLVWQYLRSVMPDCVRVQNEAIVIRRRDIKLLLA